MQTTSMLRQSSYGSESPETTFSNLRRAGAIPRDMTFREWEADVSRRLADLAVKHEQESQLTLSEWIRRNDG